jgi:hypothetical protein
MRDAGARKSTKDRGVETSGANYSRLDGAETVSSLHYDCFSAQNLIFATSHWKKGCVFFFWKFVGWVCQGHPDARWASTWVRSRLKGIADAPRSSIVIYI